VFLPFTAFGGEGRGWRMPNPPRLKSWVNKGMSIAGHKRNLIIIKIIVVLMIIISSKSQNNIHAFALQ
jgi:hypothetical protein